MYYLATPGFRQALTLVKVHGISYKGISYNQDIVLAYCTYA